MSPLIRSCTRRDRQRGAIGLIAALTMALALLCMLVVVDSGRLFLEKRSLQRVADMAALEAAGLNGTCSPVNSASSFATQAATRNGFSVTDSSRSLTTRCGTLITDANSRRTFAVDASRSDAIQVTVVHSVPRSIAAGIGAMFDSNPVPLDVPLTAVAVAAKPLPPLAQLSIRSTLLSVTIDGTKAGLLNDSLGKLLGTTVSLDVASWSGLVDTDINLLNFADQLAIKLNIKAGDYNQLLTTKATVSDLISASISALQKNGTTATIDAAIKGLTSLQLALPSGLPLVALGDLVNVQTGTPSAGLDTGLQVFQLVQTLAQLANGNNAVALSQSISVLGLASVTAKIKVIEPPQFSAVGNPLLAKAAPMGDNKIYVRTAQVRALLTVDLPALNGVVDLVNGLVNVTAGLTSLVTDLLKLDLGNALCLISCTRPSIILVPDKLKVSLGLELAPANAYVTDFDCTNDAKKTLVTKANNSLATVKVGTINEATFFSNSAPPTVSPLVIVDMGTQQCSGLILPTCKLPRNAFAGGGLGLVVDAPVLGNTEKTLTYHPVNELTQPATTQQIALSDIVGSITNTLAGISIVELGSNGNGGLGGVVKVITSTVSALVTAVSGLIKTLLSPLLDPLINSLLSNLGIDIAKVSVGANLSCHPGQVQLVI